MKIFSFCKTYLLQHKFKLSIYIVLSLITTALSILSPYITGNFLDNLIAESNLSVVIRFCIIFGTINILMILLNYLTTIIYTWVQTQMGYELNRDAILHIQRLSLSFINKSDIAYLNQRLNNDANEIVIFCITLLQNVIINFIMFVIPFAILITMNFFISIFLIIFIFIYIGLYFAFKKPLYKTSFLFREVQSKFFSSLFEQLQYIKLIKINSIQPIINERLEKNFKTLIKSTVRYQKINYFFSGLDNFVMIVAQIVLFIVGGIQILNGNFTIGMFTIFSNYFNMMIASSRYFFNLSASYQKVSVAFNRLTEIFNEVQETNGTQLINDVHSIKFEDVTFLYNDKVILKNFNTSFEKGNIYAIVGHNGAGKSTMVNLVLGLYSDEVIGVIKYNNININSIDMIEMRKRIIGFSEQQVLLINDTIKYNLSFGYSIENHQIEKYLHVLNMTEYIKNLEGGLDFIANEKNENLSGGEKQKISILKVLLKNPQVMVFDEPTSSLDMTTTRKFMEYLLQIKQDKIIIIVTHDNYVKSLCDAEILIDSN